MLLCSIFLSVIWISSAQESSLPNIILILADDLGFNDVGFHGSNQIPTPNIDALAYSGVILNNYYVQPLCTPSRGALLTGYYPIHLGLTHGVIVGSEAYGLPLNMTTLPQYLKPQGYVSHMVGKWHLGCYSEVYTPTFRGFDSFVGYWLGRQDYWTHQYHEDDWIGYDLRRGMDVIYGYEGKYTTDIIGEESVKIVNEHNTSIPLFLYVGHAAPHSVNSPDNLQAPEYVLEMLNYIENEDRRKYAGMVYKMDETVGLLMEALDQKQMLNNSIILFMADNGGAPEGYDVNAASNWPLRGAKYSVWEGGVRSAAFIWSPMISNRGRVSNQLIHITDWLPTILSLTGNTIANLDGIDGMDVLDAIIHDTQSPRTEFIYNIDPIYDSVAVRDGDWKLTYKPTHTDPYYGTWLGPTGRNGTSVEETWNFIYQNIIESPAGLIVQKMYPGLLDQSESLRDEAELICGPVPDDAVYTCDDSSNPCLFNIAEDPCEYHDLSAQYPDIVALLSEKLESYEATMVPPLNTDVIEEANPIYWNNTWNNWFDYPSPLTTTAFH